MGERGHLFDAVFGQDGGGPSDGAEVEAPVLLAGGGHGLGEGEARVRGTEQGQ